MTRLEVEPALAEKSPLSSLGVRTQFVTINPDGYGVARFQHQRLFRLEGFVSDAKPGVMLVGIGSNEDPRRIRFPEGIPLRYLEDHPAAFTRSRTFHVGEIIELHFFHVSGSQTFTLTILGSEV